MRPLLIALIVAVCASPAIAQTPSSGSITLIRTGWNADSFAIVTQEPIQNPANCPTPDGYISEKSLPGYSTYYAVACRLPTGLASRWQAAGPAGGMLVASAAQGVHSRRDCGKIAFEIPILGSQVTTLTT